MINTYSMKIKPWGYEVLLYRQEYMVKMLVIKMNHRTSLQYHPDKTESFMVWKGVGHVRVAVDLHRVCVGDFLHITARTVHRSSADEGVDLVLLEVSTPSDEVVRLEDDYART